MLKIIERLMILAALGAGVLLLSTILGCDGSGGMGGQGIVVNIYQNSPKGQAPVPDAAMNPGNAGNYSNVEIDIVDGGTALMGGNPSATSQATTQPAE